MPAPKKDLFALVRDGTFLARRHAELLLTSDDLVDDPELRSLQARYRGETSGLERRALALAFEKRLRDPSGVAGRAGVAALAELQAILDMEPAPYDPGKDRAASERFARAIYARDLRGDGLSLSAIGKRLGVSAATVSRYLAELAEPRPRR